MSVRQRYVKREMEFVVAVQLDLDTPGFTYEKWGGTQACKAGDWIVNNAGDTYTVDRDTFARTYHASGPGRYVKVTPIWAEEAAASGEVRTREGITHYAAGDYLVFNEPDGGDPYAIARDEFERMYKPSPSP
jgi:hypothetical protein